MRLISLKCPECGGGLHIEEGMSRCYCSHCGTQILLDGDSQNIKYTIENAQEAGYQFEQGRKRAQFESVGNTELANRISSLIQPATELEGLFQRSQAVRRSLSENEAKYDKTNKPLMKYSRFWLPALVILSSFLSAVDTKSFLTLLFGVLVAAGSYFAITKILEIYRGQITGKIDTDKADLAETRGRMQWILAHNDFSFIAEEYRKPDALGFFYRALISGRALNMNQAILLYEDHLQNEEDRRYQQRQIELQQQQLDELRSNNSSTVLTPWGKRKR